MAIPANKEHSGQMKENKLLVAGLIEKNQEELVQSWISCVQKNIPQASDKSKSAIRDHIDHFFKGLIETLRKNETEIDPGFEHGKQRAKFDGYTLKQLITEYHYLRNILFDFIDDNIEIKKTTRNIINTMIDQAVTEASVEFDVARNELYDFFMQAPAPLVILTGDNFRFTLANPPYEKLIGRKVMGKTLLEVFSREEVNDFIPLLQGVVETGVPFIGTDLPLNIKRDNGSLDRMFIDVGYHPFKEENGEIRGIMGVVTDVTEKVINRQTLLEKMDDQKESQIQILAEKQKFEAVFMDSPASIALLRGPTFIYEKINSKYADLFEGREILNKPLIEALPELTETELPAIMKKVFESGEPFIGNEMLVSLVRVAGGPFVDSYFDFTYSRVVDGHGKPWGTFVHAIDVTDKVLARQQLINSESSLKAAITARDEFLIIASHELKTPLTSLKLQIQSASRMIKKEPETKIDLDSLLDRNVTQVNRLIRLVDDMLNLSRVKSENLSYNLRNINLTDLVKEIHSRFKETFENNEATLNLVTEEDTVVGHFDRERIEQVIINLLTNALKYGEKKEAQLKLSKTENSAVISVIDNGMGIKPENFEIIFHRFERVISANEVSGLGIGLYITKQIVDAHQGHISVQSELGKGSTFSVELPLNNPGNSLQ